MRLSVSCSYVSARTTWFCVLIPCPVPIKSVQQFCPVGCVSLIGASTLSYHYLPMSSRRVHLCSCSLLITHHCIFLLFCDLHTLRRASISPSFDAAISSFGNSFMVAFDQGLSIVSMSVVGTFRSTYNVTLEVYSTDVDTYVSAPPLVFPITIAPCQTWDDTGE